MGKDTENSSDDYKGNTEGDIRQLVIPDAQGGQRLDQALSACCRSFRATASRTGSARARSRWTSSWGTTRMKVCGGETVRVEIEPDPGATPDAPEAIPLDVVFEDPLLLVINKPVGLVVHPGSGNWRGTLLNALLHRVPQVAGCRAPASCTGSTRTPPACWSSPRPCRRIPTWCASCRRAPSSANTWPWCMARSTVTAPSMRRLARHPHNRTKRTVAHHGQAGGHALRGGRAFPA